MDFTSTIVRANTSGPITDNIQSIVTEYMKTTGFSVGISDLISNEQTTTKITQVILDKKKEVANIINQFHLGVFENKSGRSNDEFFESEINNILNSNSNLCNRYY